MGEGCDLKKKGCTLTPLRSRHPALIGTMGAFGLFCFILMEIVEPMPWHDFLKLVSVSGGPVLIFWLWWKFNVLGCTSAADRFFRRKAELQRQWMQTSVAYQIFIMILTVLSMMYMVVQAGRFRDEHKRKPTKSSGGIGAVAKPLHMLPPSR